MALIFDSSNPKELFQKITHDDRNVFLKPTRLQKSIKQHELQFANISVDSLNSLIKYKPILSLKIEDTLLLSYTKEKKPESCKSVVMENVYNPIFEGQEMDSIN